MDDKQLKTVASMLAVGMSPDKVGMSPGKGTLDAFYVSPARRALSLASRYYVYGRYKSNMCFVLFPSSPPFIVAWPFVFITFQSSCLTGAVSPRRRLKIPSSGR
jgi:hypothetical protein